MTDKKPGKALQYFFFVLTAVASKELRKKVPLPKARTVKYRLSNFLLTKHENILGI